MKQFDERNEYNSHFKSMDNKINIAENEQKEILEQINNRIDSESSTRRKSSKIWKYYFAFSAASLIIIILSLPLLSNMIQERTGFSNMGESIHQILNERGYEKIVHQQEVDNGVVVFYIPNIQSNGMVSELNSIFIKRTTLGWEGTNDRGGYSTSINEDISSQYLQKSDKQSPFPMLYGEINNSDITQIKVINLESNHEYLAETIETESHNIWFVFLDDQEGEYEILGLSESNEVITSVDSDDNSVTVTTDIEDNVLDTSNLEKVISDTEEQLEGLPISYKASSVEEGLEALPFEVKLPENIPADLNSFQPPRMEDFDHDGKKIRVTFEAFANDPQKPILLMVGVHNYEVGYGGNADEIELYEGLIGEYIGNSLTFNKDGIFYDISYTNNNIAPEEHKEEIVNIANQMLQ